MGARARGSARRRRGTQGRPRQHDSVSLFFHFFLLSVQYTGRWQHNACPRTQGDRDGARAHASAATRRGGRAWRHRRARRHDGATGTTGATTRRRDGGDGHDDTTGATGATGATGVTGTTARGARRHDGATTRRHDGTTARRRDDAMTRFGALAPRASIPAHALTRPPTPACALPPPPTRPR